MVGMGTLRSCRPWYLRGVPASGARGGIMRGCGGIESPRALLLVVGTGGGVIGDKL
jgi:hypothetical protein